MDYLYKTLSSSDSLIAKYGDQSDQKAVNLILQFFITYNNIDLTLTLKLIFVHAMSIHLTLCTLNYFSLIFFFCNFTGNLKIWSVTQYKSFCDKN